MATNLNNNPGAWVAAGIAHAQSARNTEALAAFDHALALDPDYLDAWTCKGAILCRMGRKAEAEQAVQRAHDLSERSLRVALEELRKAILAALKGSEASGS